MKVTHLMFFHLALVVLAACGWDKVNPEAFQPSADYPCGVLGVVCSTNKNPALDECCDEGQACPGDPGCPPGVCCMAEDFDPSPKYSLKLGDAGITEFDAGCVSVVFTTDPPTSGCLQLSTSAATKVRRWVPGKPPHSPVYPALKKP
jgi:hypothetical protein